MEINMEFVFMTALGVGGATIIGVCMGFFITDISHRVNDGILSFAAGIMLAAAVIGLILPAAEIAGKNRIWILVIGMLAGAVFLNLMDRLTPHLHKLSGMDEEANAGSHKRNKALLFMLAIAIHNLPEGMAAGVGFGNHDVEAALTVAVGIALQNIPEGVVTVTPLIMAGIHKKRAFVLAACTGLIEVAGTFIGFYAATISAHLLPFALAFAGGTMLYIVSDEMIPETHSHGYEGIATYSLLAGFAAMLVMDALI